MGGGALRGAGWEPASRPVAFTQRMRRAYTTRPACSQPPSWACGPPRAAPGSSRKSKLCLFTVQRYCFHGVVSLPPPLCPLNLVALASEERPGLCRLWRDAPGSPPCPWPLNGPPSLRVRGSGVQGFPTASGQGSARRAWPGPGLPAEGHRRPVRGCPRSPEETHFCRVASLLSDFTTHAKRASCPLGF